jgi:hypothetical protein
MKSIINYNSEFDFSLSDVEFVFNLKIQVSKMHNKSIT